MPLRTAIERRYATPGVAILRERLIEVCQSYLDDGHGDGNAEQRLCSTDDATYWQQLSEVLIAHQLTSAAIRFVHQNGGPDYRIDLGGKRIWIEVITPTATNIPKQWLAPPNNCVRDFPHQEILLRWTAAIKQKAEILLGEPPKTQGYLAKGIVDANDIFVIAVNGKLLRGFGGAFDAITGISQFPFAVEATFAVGPLQVHIDRETLEASELEHQRRYLIHKPVGQPVPADAFLSQRYAPVSAIWAVDIDECSLLNGIPRMVVVHNPHATNPMPPKVLPAQDEYIAREVDDETYQLDRVDGRFR